MAETLSILPSSAPVISTGPEIQFTRYRRSSHPIAAIITNTATQAATCRRQAHAVLRAIHVSIAAPRQQMQLWNARWSRAAAPGASPFGPVLMHTGIERGRAG